ncbi:serine O-acetyltransferase [Bacillus nitroreducens]
MGKNDLVKINQHLHEVIGTQHREKCSQINHNLKLIPDFIDNIREVLLPEYYVTSVERTIENSLAKLESLQNKLQHLLSYKNDNMTAEQDTYQFLELLPRLREMIMKDVDAAFRKDPAAKSYEEIVLTYPGVFSIMVHRISHELHKMGYSLVSRGISEYSHSKTGIDIHPGATIGHSFFMDHGTGIVVGETTIIGNDVTLYQGVTLGAFSFDRDKNGEIIKGGKRRHPVIEDNVTIYAGATILGGDTVIGRDSIVGGNVWLTKSIPAGSKVVTVIQNKML